MDEIKEYIKTCIKQNNFNLLSPDKIKIISSYGFHKVYYNSDFICYLDMTIINSRENVIIWGTHLNESLGYYNELLKKKITICILCITNEDQLIIEHVMNQLIKLRHIKILLVGRNDKYIKSAIKQNIDYIISAKNEYKNMIHTGLIYIKPSNITNNIIMISNTETIINNTILTQTLIKFNQMFHFCGPTNIKYIDIDNNPINSYQITCIDTIFLTNWFLIRKETLGMLTWNLFDGPTDINESLESQININKSKIKILKINDINSICFSYNKHKKITQSNITLNLDNIEYQLLSSLIKELPEQKYKYINNYAKNIIVNGEKQPIILFDRIQDNRKKLDLGTNNIKFQTKPIIRTVDNLSEIMIQKETPLKMNVDKYYFVNNYLTKPEILTKIKSIPKIEYMNYTIVEGNINKVLGHITSIKDAITKKINKIVIIEDKLLSEGIFVTLNKNDTFPLTWDFLLLAPLKSESRISRLTIDNKEVFEISTFAYCINQTIYKKYLELLNEKKTLNESIFALQQKDNIFIICDNFNENNLTLNKLGKVINDTAKPTIKFNNQTSTTNQTIKFNNQTSVTIPNIRDMRELKYTTPNINYDKLKPAIIIPNIWNQRDQSLAIKNNKEIQSKYEIYNEQLHSIHDTNRIVQGLWIGESLSLNEILCIMSFIKNGHEFHLYIYEDVQNIPTECIIKDANDIIPENEIFYYDEKQSISGQKRPTAFSNMFRYKLLFDRGGYWVDMDMICIKYLRFNDQYVFSSESTFSRDQTVNAGIIKCPKGCEFARYCYQVCKSKDKTTLKWGEIGPRLVAEGISKYKLQGYVKPWTYFCPIGYDKFAEIITPTKLKIEKDWYCVHLWNEYWVKNKLDKNKIYYGSLFGSLVNKYCKKYVTHDIFNLELEYGKYNKSCVMIYWMPRDDDMIPEMESYLNTCINIDTNKIYNIDTCYVHKEYATANKNKINKFINSDIYVHMFTKLLEKGIIDNLHIIIGMAKNDKYLYNNEPLFTNGNYYNFNDKIYLWKLNDIKSLFSFTNAKIYFYKGYGSYEHFYSMLPMISPHSIYLRYLATALPYIVDKGSNIVIDDKWIETYSQNDLCKKKVKNFQNYFNKQFTNYDLVYVDTVEKIPNYKKIFINGKHFMKINKYSLMEYDELATRDIDLVFCASDVHPSKNLEIFYQFLLYCDKNKKEMNVLIISPVISQNIMFKYTKFKYIKTTIKRGLTSTEINECFNRCKCLLITFGRDANPRVMSESLSCGCFNIVLDILSDGKDIIKNNHILGKLIKIHPKYTSYVPNYKSINCTLTNEQHNEIYSLITKEYDHKLIADTFKNIYNADITSNELYNFIKLAESYKNKLVVTIATEDYSNNMNYLLGSLKHTNPNVMVIVYYIGWRDALIIDFKRNYPNYYFEEIKYENYTKSDIIKLKVKLQHDTYFKYKLQFIWIDADSIVLQNLNELFDKTKEYNLICYYRPNEEFYMKFAVGVIAFGLSNDPKIQKLNEEFIKKYYDKCQITEGYNDWFHDQTSLFETYQTYEHIINLYALSEREHSINDTIETIIYSRRLGNKISLKNILKTNNIDIPTINFDGITMKYD